MKNTAVKFGLISCAIMAVFMGIGWFGINSHSDYDTGMIIGFSGMFLAFSMIFFATVQERKRRDGAISFASALGIGFTITFMVSMLYVVSWLILTEIKPEVITQLFDMEVTRLQSGTTDAAVLAEKMAESKELFDRYQDSILFRAGITFTEILPVGIVITLISSMILSTMFRKKVVVSND